MADSRECFPRRYKYYEILEISKNATQEEIRKGFRHLAQKYHPDVNLGNSEAEAKFKKVNEAYQVLSNLTERAAYDSSPAECPVCWTHEVIQIGGNNWRCRHCGCQFDVFGSPLSETIERAAIPERHSVRLTAFQSMQCSWCRRFFTQPFLCPYRQLHSSCFFFKKLSEEERDKFLNDERWWWRIVDLVRQAENNGVIKKCTKCGALNPNPEKLTCWNCSYNIYDRCPRCGLPTLYFDLDDNYWKCSNAKCYRKKFTFGTKRVETIDRTPITVGIESPRGVMKPLIASNTVIPVSKSVTITTVKDYQSSLEIHVLQGEHPKAADNRTLGRFMIDGILPAPRGVPQIEVTLDIDINGILNISARDQHTGKELGVTITAASPGLSKEEIEKIKRDICPNCGQSLRFDSAMLFWRCTNPKCKQIYTYEELRKARAGGSTSYRSGFQSRETYTSKYHNESRTPYTPPRRKSRKIPKIIGITLASILAIVVVIIAAPFSPSVSISPLNLRFTVEDGLNPPAQILEIGSSREAVTWSVTDDAQWLNFDPANGSTDEETSITLSADISGMHPSEYAATVTISAPDAKNAPLEVPVNLIITETQETLAIKEALGGNTDNVEIYYGTQPPYSKELAYSNINLVNYESATDPTWQELLEFIRSDTTDEDLYLEGIHMCGSFAETLHNNAEESGIRAAWVAIDLGGGKIHALNAFNTVDKGIVFVDCTGGGFEVIPSFSDAYSSNTDYDTIAYVQMAKEYGVISLNKAESPSYSFYDTYMQDWKAYERDVNEYNQAVDEYNQNPTSYSEYERLKRIYNRLESQREALGDYPWEPLGVVSHVEIYW